MNDFITWYRDNHIEITWFLIGFLICGGLEDFSKGDLLGAVFSFGIAYLNYILNRRQQ